MNEITRQDILRLSDDLMAMSKKSLERDGAVYPAAYVLCSKMEVGPWLRKSLLDGNSGKRVTDDEVGLPGKDNLLLAIPCFYEDYDMLIHMLTYLAQNPEEIEQMFTLLRASGPQFGVENPDKRIVETFKKNYGLTEKDIVANFIRKACEETKAHTIVKVDEAYAAHIPKKEGESFKDARGSLPTDLKNAPGRKEVIQVATETKTFRRFIIQEFSRKSEDEKDPGYKEIIWGETVSNEDTVENQMFSGRFVNLLMPRPKEDLYTKKSGPSM